jgi:hypothetical protein
MALGGLITLARRDQRRYGGVKPSGSEIADFAHVNRHGAHPGRKAGRCFRLNLNESGGFRRLALAVSPVTLIKLMAVPGVDPVTREMLCETLIDHCDSFVCPYDLPIGCRRSGLIGLWSTCRNEGRVFSPWA